MQVALAHARARQVGVVAVRCLMRPECHANCTELCTDANCTELCFGWLELSVLAGVLLFVSTYSGVLRRPFLTLASATVGVSVGDDKARAQRSVEIGVVWAWA